MSYRRYTRWKRGDYVLNSRVSLRTNEVDYFKILDGLCEEDRTFLLERDYQIILLLVVAIIVYSILGFFIGAVVGGG